MLRLTLARGLLATAGLVLAVQARAEIDIEIPDVSEAIDSNVRAFLSLTRYADRSDVSAETLSRLQRRIVAETRDALQPLGYYEPEVTYEVTQREQTDRKQRKEDAKGPHWVVTIYIKPGRPIRLSEVNIDVIGEGAHERAIREAIDADSLKPGLRLNHGAYENVKSDLLRAAKNTGYLDARLVRHDLVIDRTERRANVDVQLDTGLRYKYGQIDTVQDVIDDDSMRRLLRMQSGDPYTLDSLLRTQYVLDDSQYFANVDIDSGEPDREEHTVPIRVLAEPSRKHRYAASVGYGTDTKTRGKFTWDNRRVNRAGHRLNLELLGSSIVKELSARYVVPVMDVALEKLEFTGLLNEEELGATLSQRAEVGSGLTQVLGQWQRVLFTRLSNETTTEADGTRRTDFYIVPGISYSTLPSYIVGDKVRPYYFHAELRGSPATLGSDASFLQLRLSGQRVFRFGELWRLHLRAELGATQVDEATGLPASQRFFAGGENSVRGFELNELSPRDEQGRSVGGRHLATGTIELVRDLPRNFGVAAFYDIGNAFDDFRDPMFEYSVGIGLRYNIAVASFGVDLAQPISESGRNPRLSLYISTQF
jgi:translocation and assembly module TamA